MVKAPITKKKTVVSSKSDLNLRKKLVSCCIWSIGLCVAETWTLRKVHKLYLGSFVLWCWRRMEKISWFDSVRNKEALRRVKKESNTLHAIKGRQTNWTGDLLCAYCSFYFRCRTAGYKSVFGRTCDRPPRHRFFLVSLCL